MLTTTIEAEAVAFIKQRGSLETDEEKSVSYKWLSAETLKHLLGSDA